jgi:nucleoside phosphorylase
MRILVTFAIAAEFAPWKSHHPFVPYEFENFGKRREFDQYRANFGVNEVTVLLTGMGRENAIKALQSVSMETYDLCISSGLAGALVADLKVGDIVVGRAATTLDHQVSTACHAELVSLAIASGALPVEKFLTSEKIVAAAAEKESLGTLAGVVEMETSHILAAASQCNLPAVGVRSISDTVAEDLPIDFQRIADSRGHLRIGCLLKELALQPHRLPLLVQFGRQSRAAAVSLAEFLDRYIPLIAANSRGGRAFRAEEVSAT